MFYAGAAWLLNSTEQIQWEVGTMGLTDQFPVKTIRNHNHIFARSQQERCFLFCRSTYISEGAAEGDVTELTIMNLRHQLLLVL